MSNTDGSSEQDDSGAPQPRGVLGIHLPSGKMFLQRVFTCGNCGETFKQSLTNGFRPCPRCRSFKKQNHRRPAER